MTIKHKTTRNDFNERAWKRDVKEYARNARMLERAEIMRLESFAARLRERNAAIEARWPNVKTWD